ncbi:terminase gpA endonuclease subunit [Shinella sp.]|uniref:terminase gpA endonuclease subunit n=1 Tax=Shinella sp. TaxID=1870904 RepID=UPI0039E21A25
MSLNLHDIRVEATELLATSDFAEGLEEFKQLLAEYRATYLKWPERPPFVQWVYDNINLTAQESSRAGPMRLSVYQRAIGNAVFHDPNCRQVTVLKGVQIGYSKLLRVVFAYCVAVLAKRISVVFPTDGDTERFFKDEIATLYSRVKAVAGIIREIKRGEPADTMSEQRYANGAIAYFRAAFNEDSLQSFTSWLQLADEADRDGWQPRGHSVGDKVSQLRNRGTDFVDSKLIIGSTPGIRDISIVWREWLTSDKRKLFVTCPHCQTTQELRWGSNKTRYGFRWDLDEHGHVERAYYKCDTDRDCFIQEDEKEAIIEAGEYRPTAVPTQPGNVGIHAPSWISMSPGAAWKTLAQQWLEAQGDPQKLKEFVTFKMAEPWDDIGQGIDETAARGLFRPYPAEVPDDVVLLTAGGDTQQNKEGKGTEFSIPSREFSVVGWTRHGQMRVIGHWKFWGTPGEKSSDDEVRAFLSRKFMRRDGREMSILATAMDSNGGFPEQVRSFCASFPSTRHVWAIIGNNQAVRDDKTRYVWPKRPTPGRKGKGSYYRIESILAKSEVFRLLQYKDDHAPMFPTSMPPDYLDKLLCEQKKRDTKTGTIKWDPKHGRRAEEEWVCLAYAYAALKGLQMVKLQTWGDLNLAARNLGIPETIHDPETGEIGYDGEDMSAHAQERRVVAGPLLAEPRKEKSRSRGSTATAQAPDRMVDPPKAQEALPPKQVKRRTVRQIKPTRWG